MDIIKCPRYCKLQGEEGSNGDICCYCCLKLSECYTPCKNEDCYNKKKNGGNTSCLDYSKENVNA